MNEMQVFKNDEFGTIRTVSIGGAIWFVGTDVAKSLGYLNPSNAIQRFVEPEDRIIEVIPHTQNEYVGGFKGSKTSVINESGLYSLILSSKLPAAKKFKRWVTLEVLPAIRKNGRYEVAVEEMEDDRLDLEQLELDQRIRIAGIIASCRKERLPLVAKVLNLDIFENTIYKTGNSIADFLNPIWDELPQRIYCAELYGMYKSWCLANNLSPLPIQGFGKQVKHYYPVRCSTMRGIVSGKPLTGLCYCKIATSLAGGTAK